MHHMVLIITRTFFLITDKEKLWVLVKTIALEYFLLYQITWLGNNDGPRHQN